MIRLGKKKDVEQIVTNFYEKYGWVSESGNSGEDKSFRQFRDFYLSYYNPITHAREADQFAGLDGKLLIAGGGDLPSSHLSITQKFDSVSCVDLSKRALDICKEKLGSKGEYIHASILDMPLPDNYANAVFCSHVVYHIDAAQQSAAIRQMVRVTKPGGKVVVSYHNPRAPQNVVDHLVLNLKWPIRKLMNMYRSRGKQSADSSSVPPLYFKSMPLRFWKQFSDTCDVQILPWQVFSASQELKYVKSDATAERFYRWAARFEEEKPRVAVRLWSYPLIVLTKR